MDRLSRPKAGLEAHLEAIWGHGLRHLRRADMRAWRLKLGPSSLMPANTDHFASRKEVSEQHA